MMIKEILSLFTNSKVNICPLDFESVQDFDFHDLSKDYKAPHCILPLYLIMLSFACIGLGLGGLHLFFAKMSQFPSASSCGRHGLLISLPKLVVLGSAIYVLCI